MRLKSGEPCTHIGCLQHVTYPCEVCKRIAGQGEVDGEYCEVCNKFVRNFKYQMCCSAFNCGCMGKPIYPCICSEECYNEGLKGKY